MPQLHELHFIAQGGIIPPFPLKLSITEDGLTAETSLTINFVLWNRNIYNPTSPHDEVKLRRRK